MEEVLVMAVGHFLVEVIKDAVPVDRFSEDLRHILVFGSTGVGKTSFINALTGRSLPTNGGARGVTLSSQEFLAHHDGVGYRIIDTAGLDEADGGSVSSADAVRGLARLLKRSKYGLNLMVMVVPKGRILASTRNNYELFINKMVGKSVPLLIVVTNCEREAGDMQGWVETNKRDFVSRGIQSSRMVATTFMTPDPELDNVEHMQAKVNASIERSWGAIQSCATAMPVDFVKENGGFLSVIIRRMYNSVARLFSANVMSVSESLVSIVQNMTTLNRKEARKMIKKRLSTRMAVREALRRGPGNDKQLQRKPYTKTIMVYAPSMSWRAGEARWLGSEHGIDRDIYSTNCTFVQKSRLLFSCLLFASLHVPFFIN